LTQRVKIEDIGNEVTVASQSNTIVETGPTKNKSPKESDSGKKGKRNQGRSGEKKSLPPQQQEQSAENQPPIGQGRKQKRPKSPELDLMEQVTTELSHLEVQQPQPQPQPQQTSFEITRGAYLKRNKDTLTIEGSPLVKAKKRDLRPTPVAYHRHGGGSSRGPEKQQDQQSKGQQRHGTRQRAQQQQRGQQQGQRAPQLVHVLSLQSQEHDTKDHQENVLRTLLLSGPDGCLRRPEISPDILWIDDSAVPPIQLADLLRYLLSLVIPMLRSS
jgi:hypothetical protein